MALRSTTATTTFAHVPQSLQVWLCFAHLPAAGAKLGSFCAFRLFVESAPDLIGGCPACSAAPRQARPTSSAGGRDWLCFRILPSGRAKLGSFRTFHSPAELRPHGNCLCPYAPVSPSLALFCTISSSTGPLGGQIGFVLRISPLRGSGVPARLLASVAKLGSFRTIILRTGTAPASPRPFPGAWSKLGSFCTFRRGTPTACPRSDLPTYPSPSKFGFVSHIFLRHGPSGGPNWVRSARLPPRRSEIGFVLRILAPFVVTP
jgi:hypothetical protein